MIRIIFKIQRIAKKQRNKFFVIILMLNSLIFVKLLKYQAFQNKSTILLFIIAISGFLNFQTIKQKTFIEEKINTKDNLLLLTYLCFYFYFLINFCDLQLVILFPIISIILLYFKDIKNQFYFYVTILSIFPVLNTVFNRQENWSQIFIKIYLGIISTETLIIKINQKMNFKLSLHYVQLIATFYFGFQIIYLYLKNSELQKKTIVEIWESEAIKSLKDLMIQLFLFLTFVVIGIFEFNLLIGVSTNFPFHFSIYTLSQTCLLIFYGKFNIFCQIFYLGFFWLAFFFIEEDPNLESEAIIENEKLQKNINLYYNKYFQRDLFQEIELGVINERPKLTISLL